MSITKDSQRLAELLSQQREVQHALRNAADSVKSQQIRQKLDGIRRQCIELVDRYFRESLQPILANRFPGKVRQQEDEAKASPVHVLAQFTELVNDFFVQVLSKEDDPFWKKDSAVELRNYASIAISNRGIRDVLRRRKKQVALSDPTLVSSLDEYLADEITLRFNDTGVDPADAVEIINRWETSEDERRREYARLLRLYFIAAMKMEEVADDLGLPAPTAYRKKQQALAQLKLELGVVN